MFKRWILIVQYNDKEESEIFNEKLHSECNWIQIHHTPTHIQWNNIQFQNVLCQSYEWFESPNQVDLPSFHSRINNLFSNSYSYNQVYRRAREFFEQPSIKLFGGIAFAKTNERAAKSYEPEIEQAATVQAREIALEDYLLNGAKNFFTDRQVTLDVASAGRSISNAIPEELKESVRELVVEGRTKKKILKKLIPILGLVKLKLVGFAVLAVAAIGLIAKKALFTSLIAIAIASASALSSVVAKLAGLGAGVAGLGAGASKGGLGGLFGGGNNGGSNGGYSSNNNNVEEIIAYT